MSGDNLRPALRLLAKDWRADARFAQAQASKHLDSTWAVRAANLRRCAREVIAILKENDK